LLELAVPMTSYQSYVLAFKLDVNFNVTVGEKTTLLELAVPMTTYQSCVPAFKLDANFNVTVGEMTVSLYSNKRLDVVIEGHPIEI